MISKQLWRCTPAWLKERLNPPFAWRSYSQEGEDRVVARILKLESGRIGFYVDVGAHHPQQYSNTYAFYLAGWRGINVDPRPGVMQLFKAVRPRDINLEMAIGKKDEIVTYYEFNEPGLNTVCKELAIRMDGLGHYRIVGTREVQTVTLKDILDRYLPEGRVIDFMTVDVEGNDEEVLRSNDWARYRPRLVLAEELDVPSLSSCIGSNLVRFLEGQGYELFAKTLNTLFFRDRTQEGSRLSEAGAVRSANVGMT